jgi:hypothetical protein
MVAHSAGVMSPAGTCGAAPVWNRQALPHTVPVASVVCDRTAAAA